MVINLCYCNKPECIYCEIINRNGLRIMEDKNEKLEIEDFGIVE